MVAEPPPPSRAPAGGEPSWKSDPTANVIALTDAAVRRLDDLAILRDKCQAEIAAMRAAHEEKLREVVERHQEQLRISESARLDAIRQVDADAVRRAADEAATRALTLSTQVATTATAFDLKLATVVDPIVKSVAELQRALYETQGGKAQTNEGRAASSSTQLLIGTIVGLVLLAMAAYGITREPAPVVIQQPPAVTTVP